MNAKRSFPPIRFVRTHPATKISWPINPTPSSFRSEKFTCQFTALSMFRRKVSDVPKCKVPSIWRRSSLSASVSFRWLNWARNFSFSSRSFHILTKQISQRDLFHSLRYLECFTQRKKMKKLVIQRDETRGKWSIESLKSRHRLTGNKKIPSLHVLQILWVSLSVLQVLILSPLSLFWKIVRIAVIWIVVVCGEIKRFRHTQSWFCNKFQNVYSKTKKERGGEGGLKVKRRQHKSQSSTSFSKHISWEFLIPPHLVWLIHQLTISQMGELFRSEEMQLVQLFIQAEAAHDTLDELGRLGLIQFRDVSFLLSLYLSLCLLHFLSKSFLSWLVFLLKEKQQIFLLLLFYCHFLSL